MKRGALFVLTTIFFTGCVISCSSSVDGNKSDPYNFLFTYSDSLNGFKWDCGIITAEMNLDLTEDIEGKHPLLLSQKPAHPQIPVKGMLSFSVSQTLPLQQNAEHINIVLNSKSENIDSFWLKCASIDKYDNIISLDSLDVSHNVWNRDTLTLPCKGAQYLVIKLRALGGDTRSDEDQFVWLDKMELFADHGKIKLGKIPKGEIPSKYVTTFQDGVVSGFTVPQNKKVIALGETMHGSQTLTNIQIELIKKMVEEGRCKLIMWEHPLLFTRLWDLYIQGSMPEERIDVIDQLMGPESFVNFSEFLKWLRNYNLANDRKVKIFGNLNGGNDHLMSNLFYFADAFYNDDTSEVLFPLLKMISSRESADALEYTKTNRQLLQQIMGNNYESFFDELSLHNITNINNSKRNWLDERPGFDELEGRDYHMAQMSRHYIDTLLEDDEFAVIMAHAEHVSKKYTSQLYYLNPMGSYLESYYGDDYYSIAMAVGEGEILNWQSGGGTKQRFILNTPEKSSLEGICMERYGKDLFFETSNLSKPIFMYRCIGNGTIDIKQVAIGNIKERFDAVLFIKNSVVSDAERRYSDLHKLLVDRHTKMEQYGKDLNTTY